MPYPAGQAKLDTNSPEKRDKENLSLLHGIPLFSCGPIVRTNRTGLVHRVRPLDIEIRPPNLEMYLSNSFDCK
jgi:hypothetical protein